MNWKQRNDSRGWFAIKGIGERKPEKKISLWRDSNVCLANTAGVLLPTEEMKLKLFSIEAHLREPFLYFYDKLNINLYVLDHTKGRWEQMYVYMYEHILTVPGPSQGTLMFSDSSQKPSIVFG